MPIPEVQLQPGLTPAVISTTGPDQPGVSATFFSVLTDHRVQLLDVSQVDFRGQLLLAAYVGVHQDELNALGGHLRDALKEFDQHVTVETDTSEHNVSRAQSTHVIVMLGNPVRASEISRLGTMLASFGANIDRISGITHYPVTGFELGITLPNYTPGEGRQVREALAALSNDMGVDFAMEHAGLQRRAKRLVCFDCDSTLITGEVIEMLAAHAGKEAEVAAVTERAMRGDLDFAESLRERVATLAGLDASVVDEVAADIELTPGARTTIRTLNTLGYRTAVVSGGFIQVLEGLARDLQLDYVRANSLEIVDGKLTGRVIGEIVDRQAKARYLTQFAADSELLPSQTVAVGDGANDIDMLGVAGLGIAFNAKPALKAVADATVDHPFLDEVLYMMGIPGEEIDRGEAAHNA